MRKKMIVLVLVTALVLSITPLFAGGGREAAPVAGVSRLVVAMQPPAADSNRIWRAGWVNLQQFEPMLETLIGNDPDTGEAIPRLAERWEVSADFREWTFHLRRGVQFHFDYGEMTARDVVHTYGLLSREDSQVNNSPIWRDQVASADILGNYTVVFRFHQPYFDGVRLFSRTGGELYIQSKAQWDAEGEGGVDRRLVGTGAYRFRERRPGTGLIMDRVENHWRDNPAFDELELRWVPDDTTRLAMLLSGEADAAILSRDVAAQAESRGMSILQSQLENMQQYVHFGGMYFSSGSADIDPGNPLTDVRVRQALAKAVDMDEVHEVIFRGRISPAHRLGWHPTLEGWNEDWVRNFDDMYGFDPARSRQLLAEAGYGPGDLELRIVTYELGGQPEIVLIGEALQIYWSDIGINATVEHVDFGTYVTTWMDNRQNHGDICMSRNTPIRTVQEYVSFWNTNGGRGVNFLHDDVEEKFAALRVSTNPTERDRLAREIGNFLYNQFDVIPLGATHSEVVVNPAKIAEWTWPGHAPSGLTHYYNIVPAR